MKSACAASTLPAGYELRAATNKKDFASFARLACAYHAWLNVVLRFQNFQDELACLPGSYGAATGCILLISHKPVANGRSDQTERAEDVACVAVRPLKQHHGEESFNHIATAATSSSDAAEKARHQQPAAADAVSTTNTLHVIQTCELKRLWVEQPHQQHGLGKILTAAAVEAAQQMGYKTMVLDTLETLAAANKLYEKLGFARRKPYYYNPLPGELAAVTASVSAAVFMAGYGMCMCVPLSIMTADDHLFHQSLI